MQKIIAAVSRKSEELIGESRRKAVHALIAAVPFIAYLSLGLAVFLLLAGIGIYAWSEAMRFAGKRIFLISHIKDLVFRQQDVHRFAAAPVTLALGALFSLLLFEPDVAAAAVFSLAFGDSFACLAGKCFGKSRIPFTGGKTYIGSMACFITVFCIAYGISGGNCAASLAAAAAGTAAELLPAGDYDNLLLPLAVGTVLSLFI